MIHGVADMSMIWQIDHDVSNNVKNVQMCPKNFQSDHGWPDVDKNIRNDQRWPRSYIKCKKVLHVAKENK